MAAMNLLLRPRWRPLLWLSLWIAAILVVIIASVLPQKDLPQVPAGGDKVEHLLAYFLLAWERQYCSHVPDCIGCGNGASAAGHWDRGCSGDVYRGSAS